MEYTPAFRFRVDLHVHTRQYSACAESLDPTLLARVLRRRGLHGAVITEHDQMWPLEELAALNRRAGGIRFYRGVEVSSRNGHFIVIGLTHLADIRPGIAITDLLQKACPQEAAVIHVHPHLTYGHTPEPIRIAELPRTIHALEVASSLTRGAERVEARQVAKHMGWSMVGGSDAHHLDQVGYAFTWFTELPRDEHQLAAMIRSGQCSPGCREVD